MTRNISASALPDGLRYQPEVIDSTEEQRLLVHFRDLDLSPFQFHGFTGKRRVVYYGWRYDFDGGGLTRTEPIPSFVLPTRDMVASYAGLDAAARQGPVDRGVVVIHLEGTEAVLAHVERALRNAAAALATDEPSDERHEPGPPGDLSPTQQDRVPTRTRDMYHAPPGGSTND